MLILNIKIAILHRVYLCKPVLKCFLPRCFVLRIVFSGHQVPSKPTYRGKEPKDSPT